MLSYAVCLDVLELAYGKRGGLNIIVCFMNLDTAIVKLSRMTL